MLKSYAKGAPVFHKSFHSDVEEPFSKKELLRTCFMSFWHGPEPAMGQQHPDTIQYNTITRRIYSLQWWALERSWRPGCPASPPHPVSHPSQVTQSHETFQFCEQFSYTQYEYIFVNNLSTFSTFSWTILWIHPVQTSSTRKVYCGSIFFFFLLKIPIWHTSEHIVTSSNLL